TREDVRYVIGRQRFMASGVPHLYHRLERDGQVEILTTPYYHPILPLLIDDRSALRADPSAQLPEVPFAYPDDAAFQLEEAIASHERAFGVRPRGVWPSEGAVSPEAADAIRKAGLAWFASDEGVLARSVNVELRRDEVGALIEPGLLYRPYRLANGATVIFRDRELSDRIGFVYGDMKPEDAVGDMIVKLERARDRLPNEGGPYLASIILDGENAWEQYPNNGNDFLRALYGKLEADDRFETVRISDFLEKAPATVELPRLHTGSWIEASLRVWSGEPAHARAWSALERTRRFAQEQWGSLRYMPKSVRQPLMVAEGSDWFWWYSSRNSSPEDAVFDALFRANLEVVWWFAGAEPPDDIRSPLMDPQRVTAAGNRIGAMLPGEGERYGSIAPIRLPAAVTRCGSVRCFRAQVNVTVSSGRTFPGGLGFLRPPAEIELGAYGLDLRGLRVADIGAGEGRLALGAARAAASVLAVDPDRGALARGRVEARRKGISNVKFSEGAAQSLR